MFGRLFGRRPIKAKTIQRLNDECIDQSSWRKLLINIDVKISKYHDKNDIILISSPYPIEDISKSLDNELNKLNLIYICPIIIDYIFGNEKDIESKLQFITTINMSTIKQLFETMSIIMIDIQSSEMIKIPILSSDLLISNSIDNNHTSHKDDQYISYIYWKIRWSTDKQKTSNNFQNIMDDICIEWKKHRYLMKYFNIYTGHPKRQLTESMFVLRQQIQNLERREAYLEKKIQICLKKAKVKSKQKDKKGALFELKKKKQFEKQLESIQGTKLNLEIKIIPLDDHHINTQTMDEVRSVHDETNMDEVREMNEAMNCPLGSILDDDELELELAELDELSCDELLINMDSNVNTSVAQTRPLQYQDEDDELAELEAMMN